MPYTEPRIICKMCTRIHGREIYVEKTSNSYHFWCPECGTVSARKTHVEYEMAHNPIARIHEVIQKHKTNKERKRQCRMLTT